MVIFSQYEIFFSHLEKKSQPALMIPFHSLKKISPSEKIPAQKRSAGALLCGLGQASD